MLGFLLLFASPAAAVTLGAPASDAMLPRLQQWASEDAMPAGQKVVRVVPENCLQMQAAACTYWNASEPDVMFFPDLEYLWSPGAYTEGERAATRLNFYHELAHVLDFGLPHHAYRLRWFALMHYPESPSPQEARELSSRRNPGAWFTALDADGYSVVPAEQFAQAYNYCAAAMTYPQVEATMLSSYWGFGYNPSKREYREACSLIAGL